MRPALRPRTLVLFVGDLCAFGVALWLSLALRLSFGAHALSLPPDALFLRHLEPFSLLFIVWVCVFFICGLYEARAVAQARRLLSSTLLVAQAVNIALAGLFFFFIPIFGIEPKALLFVYLAVSFALILLWRGWLFSLMGVSRGERMLVVGEGACVGELARALRQHAVAPEQAATLAAQQLPRFVIADWDDPRAAACFPALYNLLSPGARFLDATVLYEEVFGRVPLSAVGDRWLAHAVSRRMHLLYDPLKRAMDIALAILGGAISLLLYPFIMLAIKLEDGGPIFVQLDRVGTGGSVFSLLKFRSMTGNDNASYGTRGTSKLKVTRVGRFLRTSRLDELPQFWNLLRGDVSFVGPRPESPALVATYEKEIPYYGARHFIKPGLTGWAQLYHDNHPHHGTDVEATREKLSYDLYYLKHRSLTLDATVALKTLKKMLTRSGV